MAKSKKQLKREIKALRAKCQRLQLAYRDARIRLEGLADQNEELLDEINAERGNTQFQERVTNALEEIAAQGRPEVMNVGSGTLTTPGVMIHTTNPTDTYFSFNMSGASAQMWSEVIFEAVDAREAQRALIFERWDVKPDPTAVARFNAGTKLLNYLANALQRSQDASDTPPEPEESPATSPDDSSDLII